MEKRDFKAYVVEEKGDHFTGMIQTRKVEDLPSGSLLVRVHYSSLNYKDALSSSGNKGVTRSYPHTPGIDAAGVVVSCEDHRFKEGDEVIVTSYDLGMNTDGGFGEYICVPSEWAVPLPQGLTLKEAMIYGTAGLTAGMSILRLTESVKPEDGPIIVSGATGGVGSLSVAILSKLGYKVSAITGKEAAREYLLNLGATEVVNRADFEALGSKPLLKPKYAGGIDTVGGVILENILKSTTPMGRVTCCGNAGSPSLNMTVFPFILRGISLIGIDSQNYPMEYRLKVWEKLAGPWKPESLMEAYEEVSLEGLDDKIALILQGKIKGRVLVKI